MVTLGRRDGPPVGRRVGQYWADAPLEYSQTNRLYHRTRVVAVQYGTTVARTTSAGAFFLLSKRCFSLRYSSNLDSLNWLCHRPRQRPPLMQYTRPNIGFGGSGNIPRTQERLDST